MTVKGEVYQKLMKVLVDHRESSTGEFREDAAGFIKELPTGYDNYSVDSAQMVQLKQWIALGNVFIDVYGGDWCSDTRQGMSGLSKVLDLANFPAANLRYIRVDRNKKFIDIQSTESDGLTVEKRVPLVMVYLKSPKPKLLGQIVEVPNKGKWELHLNEIWRDSFGE